MLRFHKILFDESRVKGYNTACEDGFTVYKYSGTGKDNGGAAAVWRSPLIKLKHARA